LCIEAEAVGLSTGNVRNDPLRRPYMQQKS
jgi:hypothetical protein